MAGPTATEDATLLTDCDRWHALRQDINTLTAEQSQRRTGLPAKFQRRSKSAGLDPRGAAALAPDYFGGWGRVYRNLCDYERAYKAAGLGEINDRLEPLYDEQGAIEKRLMQATPKTLYGVVRLLTVWSTSMCEDVKRDAGAAE